MRVKKLKTYLLLLSLFFITFCKTTKIDDTNKQNLTSNQKLKKVKKDLVLKDNTGNILDLKNARGTILLPDSFHGVSISWKAKPKEAIDLATGKLIDLEQGEINLTLEALLQIDSLKDKKVFELKIKSNVKEGKTAEGTTAAGTTAAGTKEAGTAAAGTTAAGTTAAGTTAAGTKEAGTTATGTAAGTTAAGTTAAGTTAPGTTVAGTTAAGTTAPGTTAPGTAAGTTAPGTTAPGTTAPGTTAPGTTAPGTTAVAAGTKVPGTTAAADGPTAAGTTTGKTSTTMLIPARTRQKNFSRSYSEIISALIESQDGVSQASSKGSQGHKNTNLARVDSQLKKTRNYLYHIGASNFNWDYNSDNFLVDNMKTLFKNISIKKYPNLADPYQIKEDNHGWPGTRSNHNGVNHLMQYFMGKSIFEIFSRLNQPLFLKYINSEDLKVIEFFMFSKILTRVDEASGLQSCLFVEGDQNLKFLSDFINFPATLIHNMAGGVNCLPTMSVTSSLFANLFLKETTYIKNDDIAPDEVARRKKLLDEITLAMMSYHPADNSDLADKQEKIALYNWITDQGHYIDHCRMAAPNWTNLYKDPYWKKQWRGFLRLEEGNNYDEFASCVYSSVKNIYGSIRARDPALSETEQSFSESKIFIDDLFQQGNKESLCSYIPTYKYTAVKYQQQFDALYKVMFEAMSDLSECIARFKGDCENDPVFTTISSNMCHEVTPENRKYLKMYVDLFTDKVKLQAPSADDHDRPKISHLKLDSVVCVDLVACSEISRILNTKDFSQSATPELDDNRFDFKDNNYKFGLHGTSKEAVKPIVEGGFDPFKGWNQVLDRGTYFASTLYKTDHYCKGGKENNNFCYVFIATLNSKRFIHFNEKWNKWGTFILTDKYDNHGALVLANQIAVKGGPDVYYRSDTIDQPGGYQHSPEFVKRWGNENEIKIGYIIKYKRIIEE